MLIGMDALWQSANLPQCFSWRTSTEVLLVRGIACGFALPFPGITQNHIPSTVPKPGTAVADDNIMTALSRSGFVPGSLFDDCGYLT
uniref:Transposase n=1 Tax=Steinernema glaseri TaxID=37863 RepID=A0A1I8A6X1_9BILA